MDANFTDAILAAVRGQGWQSPAQILHRMGVTDYWERGTVCETMLDMVRSRTLKAAVLESHGIRVPVFMYNWGTS